MRAGDVVIPSEIDGHKITSIGNSDNLRGNIFVSSYEDADNSVTSVTIPAGVTSIGTHAFSRCARLTSISIPEGVTSIGYEAFWLSENLKTVKLPSSLKTVDDRAFCGCSYLSKINIPDTVTSIGKEAFLCCTNLPSITIPSSLTAIKESTFESCSSLDDITIPNSVTSIEPRAFEYCKSLTTITIPNSITAIPEECFGDCTSLASLTLGSGVKDIAYGAFGGCGLTSLTIPAGVTTENHCFAGCTKLTSIDFLEGVSGIGEYSFAGCTSLTSFTVPNSLRGIGMAAFADCTSLTSIRLPNTSIGRYAFTGCTNLTSIDVYNASMAAFSGCTSLVSVSLGSGYIDTEAFYNCDSLTSITIPGKAWINSWAFLSCSALTSAYFPDGFPHIDSYAFDYTAPNFRYYYPPDKDGHTSSAWTTTSASDPGIFYTVKIADLSGGTITADKSSVVAGETVNLTITPDSGKIYKSGSLKYNDGTKDTVVSGYLTMPASNIIVSAEFEEGINQFVANYFSNNSFSGQPRITIKENYIYDDWGYGCPYPGGNGINNDNFSVRWQGKFDFSSADYLFTAKADDAIKVYVDDKVIIDQTSNSNLEPIEKKVTMTSGRHSIKVEYREDTDYAFASLNWYPVSEPVNYRLIIGEDNNSFRHNSLDFFNIFDKGQKYFLSDKLYQQLVRNQIKSVQEEVQNYMKSEWEGSCYGLSASMALSKTGDIDINNFDPDAYNYYHLDKPGCDTNVRDLINYYQLSQYLPEIKATIVWAYNNSLFKKNQLSDVLKKIVEKAQSIDSGGEPFIIRLEYRKGGLDFEGHAVVGNRCMQNLAGDYKIQIVDPNYQNKYGYLYIPADYTGFEYVINDYFKVNQNTSWSDIGYQTLESVSSIDIDGNSSNACISPTGTTMYLDSSKICTIADASGNMCTWSEQGMTGDLIPESVDFIAGSTEDGDNTSQMVINFPQKGYYKVTGTEGSVDVSTVDDERFAAVEATGVSNVEFLADNAVHINGINCNYKATIANPTGSGLLEISDNSSGTVSIEQKAEGIVVKSDNMKNINIASIPTPNSDRMQATISTDRKEILINDKPNDETGTVQILISNNDNGVFDKIISETASGNGGGGGSSNGGGGSTTIPTNTTPETANPPVEPMLNAPLVQEPSDLAGHWAHDRIMALLQSNLITGYPDGTIQPENEITRAEAASLVVSALGLDNYQLKSQVSPYKDQLPIWAQKSILTLTEKKLMNGYLDGTFRPDQKITRAEMCVVLLKAFPKTTPAGFSLSFTDADDIPDWARPFIEAAVSNQVVSGYPENTFRPGSNIKRAEAFSIIYWLKGY